MHELQQLGEALTELTDERLRALPLSETLLDAVLEFQRTRSHEGAAPAVAIHRQADARRRCRADCARRWRRRGCCTRARRWRCTKPNAGATSCWPTTSALTPWMQQHPASDVQHLRSLVRAARQDRRRAAAAAPAPQAAPTASCSSSSRPASMNETDLSDFDPVRIGLVSVSDRASGGVYEDKGIPGAARLAGSARCATRSTSATRLIPDDAGDDQRHADRAGRRRALRPRAHHRRHRPRAARRDARGHARGGHEGDAGLRRADAADQPALRAHRDPVAPGRGDPRQGADHQPARAAEVDRRNARRAAEACSRRCPASLPRCPTAST